MPDLPDSSHKEGYRCGVDSSTNDAIQTLTNTRSDQIRGGDEMSMDIFANPSNLDLGNAMAMKDSLLALAHAGSKKGPGAAPIAHGGSRVESTISNSQITSGRDTVSYNFTGNLTINNYEGATTESGKQVLQRGNYKDNIASGMLIPPPPLCILERDAQHDQIVDKLLSTNNARVAILGMGGIGKTTLACSVADDSQVVEAYPHRLFLSFEGCSTADLAYTNVATAFQTPVDQRSSHRQILSHVLCYLKQQKTLLIIDNFETFWEVSSNRRAAEDFLNHLAALRKLAMIVTLRGIQRPGNIRWIKIDPLQTLTQDASMELLSIITDEDYAKGSSEYIQQLLEAVAGIPLAVTLIGTLLRDESETPRSLWNQWTRESARAIRVANEVDSDDRLYKLDISLRLSIFSPRMSENTKEVLAAISILPLGLNVDEEWLDDFQKRLSSTIRIRDCIRTLRDVALATLDSSSSPHRLRLLPPVRDFCLNHLPLLGGITLRLIDSYNADLNVYWDFGSSKAYTWVTTELSNITAILNHAITIHHVTQELGPAIHCYTDWRRFLRMPDTAIVKQAINFLSEFPAAKSLCLQGLGGMLLEFGQLQEAVQQLEQALSIHRELGEQSDVGLDLDLIGRAHSRLGDFTMAERYAIEARDIFTEMDRDWEKGAVLQSLADIYLAQEKYPQSECTAKEALERCQASGNRREEVNVLNILGEVYRKQGKYDLAVENLKAAQDASQATHDGYLEGHANEELGYLYSDTNRPDQATLHLQLALTLFERAQDNDAIERVRKVLTELDPSSYTSE